MKVLITGASGFVGKAIVAELVAHSIDVVPVGGPRSKDAPNTAQQYRICVDISHPDEIMELDSVGNIDAVIHAAGLAHRFSGAESGEYIDVNVLGVRYVAELAVRLNAKHFLLISSVLVYGAGKSFAVPGQIIDETAACTPTDIYSRSKLGSELEARRICEGAGMNLTIFRPVPIIGEGSKGNFARLIRAIDKRRFIWIGKGENRKSLICVADVARAVQQLIAKKKHGTEIFNLVASSYPMKEIVARIASELGRKIPPFSFSSKTLIKSLQLVSHIAFRKRLDHISDTVEQWISEEIYSAEAIERAYAFRPEIDVLDAVGREVNYYIDSKMSDR